MPSLGMRNQQRMFSCSLQALRERTCEDIRRPDRVVASGESGRVKKKITAILDTGRVVENPWTKFPNAEKDAGVLQYWREE